MPSSMRLSLIALVVNAVNAVTERLETFVYGILNLLRINDAMNDLGRDSEVKTLCAGTEIRITVNHCQAPTLLVLDSHSRYF
jgi:hypothetical protein